MSNIYDDRRDSPIEKSNCQTNINRVVLATTRMDTLNKNFRDNPIQLEQVVSFPWQLEGQYNYTIYVESITGVYYIQRSNNVLDTHVSADFARDTLDASLERAGYYSPALADTLFEIDGCHFNRLPTFKNLINRHFVKHRTASVGMEEAYVPSTSTGIIFKNPVIQSALTYCNINTQYPRRMTGLTWSPGDRLISNPTALSTDADSDTALAEITGSTPVWRVRSFPTILETSKTLAPVALDGINIVADYTINYTIEKWK